MQGAGVCNAQTTESDVCNAPCAGCQVCVTHIMGIIGIRDMLSTKYRGHECITPRMQGSEVCNTNVPGSMMYNAQCA